MKELIASNLTFLFRLSQETADANRQRFRDSHLIALLDSIVYNGVTVVYQTHEPGKFIIKDKKKIDAWKEITCDCFNDLLEEIDGIKFMYTDPKEVHERIFSSIQSAIDALADKLINHASL